MQEKMQTGKPNQHRRSIERYVWISGKTKIIAAVVCLLLAFVLWLWAVAVQSEAEGAEDVGAREYAALEVCDEAVVFCVDVNGEEMEDDRCEA